VPLIKGLHSPGPTYVIPDVCFKKASKTTDTGRPSWGPPPKHDSLKLSRARTDEVRYQSHGHMREMMGHFSPGPQYALPPGIGGAAGNGFNAMKTLQKNVDKYAPQTYKLHATQLGAEPCFSLTPGSFADPSRRSLHASRPASSISPRGGSAGPRAPQTYWRQATVMQDNELAKAEKSPNVDAASPTRKPWAEANRGRSCYGDRLQEDAAKTYYTDRGRTQSPTPLRQLADVYADPPLANVFGSLTCNDAFGQIGGVDRKWRESKVAPRSTGTVFGPPPRTGPLRVAHVQPIGANSIPRTVPQHKSDFDGGRITMYAIDRPMTAEMDPAKQVCFDDFSAVGSSPFPSRPSHSRERDARSPTRALESPFPTHDLHGYSDTGSLSPSRPNFSSSRVSSRPGSLGPSRMTSRSPSRTTLARPAPRMPATPVPFEDE